MSLRWAQARAEIRALEPEIAARLKNSISKRQVYDALKREGLLTASERTFYRHIALMKAPSLSYAGGITKNPSQKSPSSEPSPPPPVDHIWGKPREGFGHKSNGATDDFLDSVYGITPCSQADKEPSND